MANYFRVSTKMWNEDWPDDVMLLAFYLLTCKHRNTEGLFKLPLAYIQADMGWSLRKIKAAFKRLVDDDFVRHDPSTDVVLIVKALKYQSPQNPNQVIHALSALETVPVSILDTDFGLLAQRYAERLSKELPERYGKSPALPPSPTPSSPPSSTDVDDESLTQHLENQGFDAQDIAAAVDRLKTRAKFGTAITDPAAYLMKVLTSMAEAREAGNGAGPKTCTLEDGTEMRFANGSWEELEEVTA